MSSSARGTSLTSVSESCSAVYLVSWLIAEALPGFLGGEGIFPVEALWSLDVLGWELGSAAVEEAASSDGVDDRD